MSKKYKGSLKFSLDLDTKEFSITVVKTGKTYSSPYLPLFTDCSQHARYIESLCLENVEKCKDYANEIDFFHYLMENGLDVLARILTATFDREIKEDGVKFIVGKEFIENITTKDKASS